jgi:hypothetical protein
MALRGDDKFNDENATLRGYFLEGYCTGTPGYIGWWNRFLGIVLDYLNVYKFGHSWSVDISFKNDATVILILLVSFMAPQNSNFQSRHFPAINSNRTGRWKYISLLNILFRHYIRIKKY